MTQKHVQISAYAVLLILGLNTTRAETKKEGSRELLPAPKCRCAQLKRDVLLDTTEEHARGDVVYQVHPLGSLVAPADPVILPLGDGDLFFGWFMQTPAGMRLLDETPEDLLINLITQSIAPATWSDKGGPGTIDYFATGKSLVVSQTPDVQEQITDLLSALRRHVKKNPVASAPNPFLTLPLPSPTPMVSLPHSPSFTIEPPMPCPQAVPSPGLFAASPLSPTCPLPNMMQPQALWPAPVETAPAPRAYVLEVEMKQLCSDGKTMNCQHQQIALPAKHFFCANSGLIMAEETDNEYRKGLLQVKATVLKNDRLRVELIGVQTRARTQEDGRVALDLDTTPLMDRTVKLGKTVKKVLEKDNSGSPRKWVQLMVREMPAVAMPPAGCRNTAAAPALVAASPMPCQAGYPVMQPAVAPCVALQVHDEPNKSWELRAAVEEGNTKIALRQGDQQAMTVKSLEIKTENGPLEVTFCGEQIHLENRWLQACADALSSRAPDGRLLLEGHVNVTYRQGDQHMVVTAERVFVDLASGHLQIEGQRSINSSREDLSR